MEEMAVFVTSVMKKILNENYNENLESEKHLFVFYEGEENLK